MSLADLLGMASGGVTPDNLLGMPPRPAYGGYQVELPPQAAPQNAQAQAVPQAPHQPSKFRNFLGAIGDALLVSKGLPPLYHQRMEEQRQNQALSGFLTNPDQAIAQLMQADPKMGIELWKGMHPASEKTMEQKVYEYEQSLPAEQRPAFEKSIALTHPGLVAPITMGPTDTYDPGTGPSAALPHVTDQKSYDAVPSGGQFTTADGKIRTKGGATASPSPTFPVSKVLDAITSQESGGNGMALSPAGALGSTQLMEPTAKQMAGKLGLAFAPQMLRSNNPQALKYQRALAEAYFNEGLSKTGNLRDALRYYHGGPDTSMWGPKTNAYADAVLSRLGGR